jgi:hypothetical protein
MQVKRIPTPVEAHLSDFGSCGFWLADSREVACFTHVGDRISGYPKAQPSAWMGIPVGRDVLLAACMVEGLKDVTLDGLTRMSADEVRQWALWALLYIGTSAAKDELDSAAFAARYTAHTDADPESAAELPAFFRLVAKRLDEAFGFDADPAPVAARVPASRPAPARELVTV